MVNLKTHSVAASFVFLILVGMTGYSQASEDSFFGMKIEQVQANENRLSVTTTGAIYILEQNQMEMWRRIDPASNTFNPRLVARLEFDTDIVEVAIVSQTKDVTEIHTPVIDFTFHADSFFFVKANASFSYRHINLIENAIWNRPVPAYWGSGLNRMWTDGYGGSLHAWLQGSPATADIQINDTTMQMNPGDRIGHMVYPPRLFNFHRLYGENARPFVCFISSPNDFKKLSKNWEYYKNLRIGVIVLWNNYYQNYHYPTLLEELDFVAGGTLGYRLRDEIEPLLSDFLQEAHEHGFKVISYLRRPSLDYNGGLPTWIYPEGHPQAGQRQSYATTLHFMKSFQDQYDLDGWYMDNADAGTLWEDYDFIKQARRDVDLEAQSHGFDSGVIYHHNTTDIWSYRVGDLNAIMINAHVDYILRGEWHERSWVDHPNELYLRFYSSGYGLCQSFGSHKRCTRMKLALSEEEKNRVMADLNGVERTHINKIDLFLHSILPSYEKRRNEYLSGNFDPDVQWPVNTETGWFRIPENITVSYPDPTSAVVNWRTNDLATSEVTYSSSGHWWPSKYQSAPDGIVSEDSMVYEHSMVIPDLDPNKNYEFRIRSSNGKFGLEEVIWGHKRENVHYTVMASAGEGGRITPNGTVSVHERKDRTFSILPNLGYQITDVHVDGIPQGPINTYMFPRVSEDHTIKATFHWTGIHTITTSAGQGGLVFPGGSYEVTRGTYQKIMIIPFPGYQIADVIVDNVSQGAVDTYTFTSVTQNHTIQATFAIQTYTITATAGEGGNINPAGAMQISAGESVEYTIIPAAGYRIADVLVDGVSEGIISSYTFHNVKQDHTLNVIFGEVNINMDDNIAPRITNCAPLPDSIQVPRNSLIKFHVIDSETGVDPNSIVIQIEGETIYAGGVTQYNSARGCCRRIGAPSDYCFVYQPNEFFDFDQEIEIFVIVSDRAGNAMTDRNAYSFQTEMRRFGGFQSLHPDNSLLPNRPRTVCDGLGTLWVIWEAGPEGSRNIYIGRLLHDNSRFDDALQITNLYSDQCRPAIAVDTQNKIYVVWQDKRRDNWDLYLRTSTDGRNWSPEISLIETDQDKANQTNPRIALASDNTVYVVWQDDRHGNQDIYLASSSNGFAVETVSSLTTDKADQTQPNIVVDADDNVFVVWTDARHDSTDIYGAGSLNNWINVPVVNNAANQTQPAIASESEGSILHFTWTDDSNGNKDIFYAATKHGLPDSHLNGVNIVDDSKGADQTDSAIVTCDNGGNTPKIYICWQDDRNVTISNQDQDIYFTEGITEFGVNILVTDDSSEFGQGFPTLGVDSWGLPYLVWSSTEDGAGRDIMYCGTTRIQMPPLAEKEIPAQTGGYVGANPENISSLNDVCVEIPAGAFWSNLKVGIMKIENPSVNSLGSLVDVDTVARFEFGPSSSEEFAKPVIITIPYESNGSEEETIYWFNPKIDDLSQSGISNVERIAISDTLYALRFTTTHFTQYVVASDRTDTTTLEPEAGGGGGCALSRYPVDTDGIEIFEFFLPFIVLMGILFWIKQKEKKSQNILTLAGGKQRISADSEGRAGTDTGEISPSRR